MLLTRSQVLALISPLNNQQLQDNQIVQIMMYPQVNFKIRPFEGNINTGEPQGLKPYLEATRGI